MAHRLRLPEEIVSSLRYPEYWRKPLEDWGVIDWDMFYIKQVPEASKHDSHSSLGYELKALLEVLPENGYLYHHANRMKQRLKEANKLQANINLWKDHMEKLSGSEVNNRVNMRNLENISITTGLSAGIRHFETHQAIQEKSAKCQGNSDMCTDLEDNLDDWDNKEQKEETVEKRNKTGPYPLTEEHRQMIEQVYNNMKKERMWKLSGGKYIEEELFKLGKKLEFEHAVHSFILDVDDEIIKQHFSETELNEIDGAPSPEVPELSDDIINCLSKFFDKKNLDEIRETIKNLMFGNNYDHEKHHDTDYITFALYALVREIQNGSLRNENLENWFNCHIWSAIFDQAFGDLNAISVVRKESMTLVSVSRKNAKRQTGERRKMDRRVNWTLRSVSNGDKDEFGAGEAGKSWMDEGGTKFLREVGLKLPKTLKDMLVKLMWKAEWDEERCAKIQTIGIIHAGLIIMAVYLDNPKGYICRIRRGELMEVPDNAEDFPSILTILASVLNIKAMVRETIKAVQSNKQTVESFKTVGYRKRPIDKNEYRLFSCLPTPKKTSVCVESYDEKSYPLTPYPGLP